MPFFLCCSNICNIFICQAFPNVASYKLMEVMIYRSYDFNQMHVYASDVALLIAHEYAK